MRTFLHLCVPPEPPLLCRGPGGRPGEPGPCAHGEGWAGFLGRSQGAGGGRDCLVRPSSEVLGKRDGVRRAVQCRGHLCLGQQRCAAHPRAQRQGRSLQRWARGQTPSLPTASVSLVPGHGDARQQVGCWSGPRRKGMHWLSWLRGRQPPGRLFLPGGDGMAPSRLAADGGMSSGAFTLLEGRMLVRRGRASCVPVMVDVFASQAAPWELAPRSRMQAGLCGEWPTRGSCHTPSPAFSFQESPAAKDGHSRDTTSAGCVPGKEGRDSGDR